MLICIICRISEIETVFDCFFSAKRSQGDRKSNDNALTEAEYLSILYLNGDVLYGNKKFKYQNR